MDSIAGISYYLNKCQMLLKVDDSFVFQQYSVYPVHLEFNTVRPLQCQTLIFLSAELNSTDYKIQGVVQQHEYELFIIRLNKLTMVEV